MKASALKYTVLTWVSLISATIILLIPFHAFLTVAASSELGHYTALRLWKEVLLLFAGAGVLLLLALDHKIRSHALNRRLVLLVLGYIVFNLLYGLYDYHRGNVTHKALAYGLLIDLRFPAFFLITWAVALRTNKLRVYWQNLILWPTFIVVLFGLLQALVLPHDFLRHFGYGPNTIVATETINHNAHYVRIMSTLRGANPLGAYLIVPISFLSVLLVRIKQERNWRGWLLAGSLATLFFSFSRSAWIGAFVSIVTILAISLKKTKIQRSYIAAAGVVVVILAGLVLGFRHNAHFQNVFLHTESHSAIKTTSDQGHVAAFKDGVRDVAHRPLGDGPGTAGPASVYNVREQRIAENYFIQIGQETGLIGLILFILINLGVAYLLWLHRGDPLALSLFASLIGLTVVNLLSHAWADDTLAYIWWGMAGIAMAPPLPNARKS